MFYIRYSDARVKYISVSAKENVKCYFEKMWAIFSFSFSLFLSIKLTLLDFISRIIRIELISNRLYILFHHTYFPPLLKFKLPQASSIHKYN